MTENAEKLWFNVDLINDELIVSIYASSASDKKPEIMETFIRLWGICTIKTVLHRLAKEFSENAMVIYALENLLGGYANVGLLGFFQEDVNTFSVKIVLCPASAIAQAKT